MKLYIINKILIVKDVSPNLKRYIMLENIEIHQKTKTWRK